MPRFIAIWNDCTRQVKEKLNWFQKMQKPICLFPGAAMKFVVIQSCLEAWDWLRVVIQTADSTGREIPLCLRCSWQSALFYIIHFTCSAFRVPSRHSGLGTPYASWCETPKLKTVNGPIKKVFLKWTSLCFAVLVLWMSLGWRYSTSFFYNTNIGAFLSLQRDKLGHSGASVHTFCDF